MSANDKRQELRLDSDDTVFVELSELAVDQTVQSRIAICEVLDISANGLRVVMDEAPPLHSILRICVQLAERDQRLYLAAETKWIKPESDGGFQIGFSLFESDETDIEAWKRLIVERIN